jgi:hypothetical protein
MRLVILPVAVMLAAVSPVSHAQQPLEPAKVAVIHELLEVNNVTDLMVTAFEAQIPALRLAQSDVPSIFWDEFQERVRTGVPQLVELLVPIYAAHYSLDDLRQLVAWSRTPLGQRVAEKNPLIAQESILAGQRWGAMLSIEIAKDLAARGIVTRPVSASTCLVLPEVLRAVPETVGRYRS